jgi:Phosphotransferase enzyme family
LHTRSLQFPDAIRHFRLNNRTVIETRINQVASLYGLRPRGSMRSGGGFSGAMIFRLTCDDDRQYAVRGIPLTHAIPVARQQELGEFVHGLSRQGVHFVPVPLQTSDTCPPEFRHSRSFVEMDGHRWTIEPWLPGAAVEGTRLNDEQLCNALLALRELHRAGREVVSQTPSRQWFYAGCEPSPALLRRRTLFDELSSARLSVFQQRAKQDSDQRIGRAALRVCDSLLRWRTWLRPELDVQASIPVSVQPVLRDLWHVHVLFMEQRVSGFVDLTAAGTDHVAMDLARLLRSWFGSDAARIDTALSLSRTLQLLQPGEIQLYRVLDAANVLLSPMTWVRRRYETPEPAVWSAAMTARLLSLADVAESLAPVPTGLL